MFDDYRRNILAPSDVLAGSIKQGEHELKRLTEENKALAQNINANAEKMKCLIEKLDEYRAAIEAINANQGE